MNFWETIKKDLQKSLKEGVDAVKEGAVVLRKKAEDLGDEAKKQYAIHDLKTKVHKMITELGGRIYDLHAKTKNPLSNKSVQSLVSRIKKIEMQIAKLEGKKGKPGKKGPGTTSRKKKPA